MSVHPIAGLSNIKTFEEATRKVLAFLNARTGFPMSIVTRVEGDDWIVLAADDREYGVTPGRVINWQDSYCSRMVKGEGPMVAPRAAAVAAYVEAPINRQMKIGAYIGFPLRKRDGSLFGTLCAVDPRPHADDLAEDAPLFELLADLLSRIIDLEIESSGPACVSARTVDESRRDESTGLLNRQGWEEALVAEDARCQRFGIPAVVLQAEIDGLKGLIERGGQRAGNELVDAAAKAMRDALRETDAVANLGDGRLGALVLDVSIEDWDQLQSRLEAALEERGIPLSIGWARRDPRSALVAAAASADSRMCDKKRMRQQRPMSWG